MVQPASEYNKKRNFDITPEPPEEQTPQRKRAAHSLRFVVQKHEARGLHYDFRLELEGTLKSWAVPKGPSLDPANKRMAIPTEDHPLAYAKFEGHIPHGQYGGGDMIVWDEGIWEPQGDAITAFKSGKLKFRLIGEKLSGDWTLVRTRGRGDSDKEPWLLIKERDEVAQSSAEYDILVERPESILSGELLPGDKTGNVNKKISPIKKNKRGYDSKAIANKTHRKITPNSDDKILIKAATKSDKKSSTKKKVELSYIPKTLSPQLATLVSEPPAGDWVYEIKFDGYRMLARILDDEVKLFSRNGNDWTARLPVQVEALEALKLRDSWLDGEVVVLNENGLPSFQALQNAFESNVSQDIIFYLFDAPYLNNEDLRELPMEERRKRLKKIIPRSAKSTLRYSGTFDADHRSIVQSACAMSLEGVIGKRIGSHYVSRRNDDWIKLKCRLRQEFVIVGFTEPQGSRSGFGALLLAVHKEPKSPELIYAGRVGTGFDTNRLDDMHKKMKVLEQSKSPISTTLTGPQARGVHWIKPKLICEVEFAEWTGEGILRQASFIALRTDKPVKDIIREQPKNVTDTQPPSAKTAKASKTSSASKKKSLSDNSKPEIAGIAISNPGRIIDTTSKGTKIDLVAYYEQVAELILPQLQHRPVSLLRAPDGIIGQQFFQKHADNNGIPHITQLDKKLDPEHDPLMMVDSIEGLVSCVQMNTVEFHTWGATTPDIDTPDRFVLDLDPDSSLPWRSVLEATKLTLSVLDELKLTSFLKTTGGKGMHIIVPLTPEAGWDYVKAFTKSIAEFMATQIPDRFVAKMGPKNRIGKIFVDYLRNSRGASTVSAYSVRARPGLTVSVPIERNELEKVMRPDQWHIGNLGQRLEKLRANPWGSYSGNQFKSQKISSSMWKKLGIKEPSKG